MQPLKTYKFTVWLLELAHLGEDYPTTLFFGNKDSQVVLQTNNKPWGLTKNADQYLGLLISSSGMWLIFHGMIHVQKLMLGN